MPKLFVAVDLPPAATAALALIRPPPRDGVRLAEPDQMHLTLHYLGEADVERTAVSLRAVAALAFPLTFDRVGQFPSAGGSVTLWAGVRDCPALLELHAAVAAALAELGFRPEARRYTPHVTLARCGSEVIAGVVDEFLVRNAAFSPPAVPVTEFALYSSVFVGNVPMYRRERAFALQIADGETPAQDKP